MHGRGLVLVDCLFLLRTGHRLCLDPGLDPGDGFVMRRHAYAHPDTDSYTDADSDANPDSYADTDTDAHTDADLRVQPV